MAVDELQLLKVQIRLNELLVSSLLIEGCLQEMDQALIAQKVSTPGIRAAMDKLRETLSGLSVGFTDTDP